VRALLLPLAVLLASEAPSRDALDGARFRLLNEALTQAESPRGDWDPGQRDCAGFVRFLYRKSLGATDALWRDKDGRPARFVKAEELLSYNFSPLSREPATDRIETGDLLAFYNPDMAPADAWHLMLLLRPPGAAPDRILVVYHNGARGPDAAVRKVWLDDLLSGPPEWRPGASNPRFLGTFRWNGWRAHATTKKEP
jgi:uncharacterized protein YfaT (DUF1175 family)